MGNISILINILISNCMKLHHSKETLLLITNENAMSNEVISCQNILFLTLRLVFFL